MEDHAIQFVDIQKDFPGVKALKGVSFNVDKGSVHAIMGENGAGKSTLINILSGVCTASSGKILINGKEARIETPWAARQWGISTIHQELNIIPDLDVKYNLFAGNELTRGGIFMDNSAMRKSACKILNELGLDLNPDEQVKNLSVAQCKTLEIGRAINQKADIIIMDEPTASISDKEVGMLFRFIEELKNKRITILYISHKIEEIYRICDSITVLRDGQHVLTGSFQEVTPEQVVKAMINRSGFTDDYPKRAGIPSAEILLKVTNLSLGKKVQNVSFDVRKGEIFGIAGIVGSGRSELAKAIIGEFDKTCGTIEFKGEKLNKNKPWNSIKRGFAYLSEDRKNEGLFLDQSVQFNTIIASLDHIRGFLGLNSHKKAQRDCDEAIKKLGVITASNQQLVGTLSGGNQQKLVIAKWLSAGEDLLIFDEPTVGIDIGAKYEIRKLVNNLVDSGKSAILISSEFNEVCSLSDRLIVMREGRIVKYYGSKQDISKEEAFQYAMGSKE